MMKRAGTALNSNRKRGAPRFPGILTASLAIILLSTILPLSGAFGADPRDEAGVPPRTVADIIEVLKSGSGPDTAVLMEVAGQPDTSGEGEDAARFFARRAEAAERLGRTAQAVSDWRRATQAGSKADGAEPFDRVGWQVGYGLAEITYGDITAGMAAIEKATEELQDIRISSDPIVAGHAYGRAAVIEATVAMVLAFVGDMEKSREALSRAKDHLSELNSLVIMADTHGVTLDSETQSGIALSRATVQTAEARTLILEGRFAEALENQEQAVREALWADEAVEGISELNLASLRLQVRRGLIDAFLAHGRLGDAEIEARAALHDALPVFGAGSAQVAETMETFNELLLREGRYRDSRQLAEAVIGLLGDAGTGSTYVLKSRVQLARALASEGNWQGAAKLFEEIAGAIAGTPHAHLLDRVAARSLAFFKTGKFDLAKTAVEAEISSRRAMRPENNPDLSEAQAFATAVGVAAGGEQGLEQTMAAAVGSLIARVRDRDRISVINDRRLRVVADAYSGLFGGDDGATMPAEGADTLFKLAEIIRGSSVAEAVSASAVRISAGDSSVAEAVRRRQDLANRREATLARLSRALSVSAGGVDVDLVNALREEAKTLEEEYDSASRVITEDFPDHDRLQKPPIVPIGEFASALSQGEAAVTLLLTDTGAHIWAVKGGGEARYARSGLTSARATELVAKVRASLDPGEISSLEDIPAFDAGAAHEIYQGILAPVAQSWESAQSLFIVADGALTWLPLGLLTTTPWQPGAGGDVPFAEYRGAPWLIRKTAVSRLSSSGELPVFRGTERSQADRAFLGFGDPVFSQTESEVADASRGGTVRRLPRTREAESARLEDLPRLPETADEIVAIADRLGAEQSRDIRLRDEASEKIVFELDDDGDLDEYRVISLATHGLVPGDLDGLHQPALALSNPAVTGSEGDGLLTLDDILKLKLRADWVILSACNTGAAEGEGADAVSGLGRAFFFAGARALLVSNWPVHSQATKDFMVEVFKKETATTERGAALNAAMQAMIDGGGLRDDGGTLLFSYAHPLFWAPFTLYGDPGKTGGSG